MSTTYLSSPLSLSLILSLLINHSTAQYEYDPNDIEAQNAAGAAGPSSGGGMSSGGMIALCVIVGVVVIIGFSSAALFYVAKKRQWAMREALRRSAKSVVRAIKTPLTPRFPRSQRPVVGDSSRSRDRTRDRPMDREAIRAKAYRKPTDVEKAPIINEEDGLKPEERKARGWSSYFSFGRS
ncbi:hypothetical protein BJY04DRAFT_180515 [Aspergillus karnatakaensis]|uniref:uncharacterized protein n=1 Tax=Aspergillus karnatakaensis TaxID=1810916 RepID=UPI003CCD6FF9